MELLPFGYEKINSATWMFLTSMLAIALFFKFNRFWSVRNLDLVLFVLLGPGMVMALEGRSIREHAIQVHFAEHWNQDLADSGAGMSNEVLDAASSASAESEMDSEKTADQLDQQTLLVQQWQAIAAPTDSPLKTSSDEFRRGLQIERFGYLWLFAIGGLLLVRLLLDAGLRRRPQLEPNLNSSGLVFIAAGLLALLIYDIVQTPVNPDELAGANELMRVASQHGLQDFENPYQQHGPGYWLLHAIPAVSTFVSRDGGAILSDTTSVQYSLQLELIAKTMAILCQLGILCGIFLLVLRYLGNVSLAIAVTALYLLLPFTGQMSGRIFHVLPALLLVWSLALYQRPHFSGFLIGLAAGVFYYPLFLLPLWFSYYWERGRKRFLVGLSIAIILVVGSLVFVATDVQDFFFQLRQMFGFWRPKTVGVRGIWALGWDPLFRLPLMVAFLGLSVSFAFWPLRKDLGVLISCTAATMVTLQFCHGFGGGLYIAWYLPLALITTFRPNLEDRIAINDVSQRGSKNGSGD